MTVVEHVSISKHTENHQTEIEEKIEDNEINAFVVYIRHFVNAERTSFKSWIFLVYNERTPLPDPYMIYLSTVQLKTVDCSRKSPPPRFDMYNVQQGSIQRLPREKKEKKITKDTW